MEFFLHYELIKLLPLQGLLLPINRFYKLLTQLINYILSIVDNDICNKAIDLININKAILQRKTGFSGEILQ